MRKNDCAFRAISAVTGISLARLHKTFGPMPRGGLLSSEIQWLIDEVNFENKLTKSKSNSLDSWIHYHRKGKFVVSLGSSFLGNEMHAVAVVDGKVVGHYQSNWPVIEYWEIGAEIKGE